MIHRELLIGGHFIGGVCDQAIGKQVVRSPYDMTIVGSAAEAGPGEVEAAVNAANHAYPAWSRTPRPERQALLRRIALSIRERREELAQLAVAEIGKPVAWAEAEVDRCAITFDLAADLLDSPARESASISYDPRGTDYEAWVERFPIGPILCTTPYNWPFNLAAHKIAPALAAGNAIVLKGSGAASLCTLTLARLIHEAGCPPGVLNAVNCEAALAEKVATDPRIKMVSFTGSPAVGWHLKRLCTEKRVALELGADSSAIVCEDADFAWASTRCALGGFGYAGQICISVQHVLCLDPVYDEFRQWLLEATKATPFGDPQDRKCVAGPLISPEAAVRVTDWIAEAIAAGGRILTGGNRVGNCIEPTLIEFATPIPQVRLTCEEVFGPVLTLTRVETFTEALERVNSSAFGIHTGVFTNDSSQVEEAFRTLDVGGVVIDDYPTLRFDGLPYGGTKRSGFGREGVQYAFDEMTDPKSLVVRSGSLTVPEPGNPARTAVRPAGKPRYAPRP